MGSITTALQNLTGANEDEQRQKERLQILLLAAKSKIQTFRDEINENFLNPGQIDKKQIPGIRALRFIEQYHVAVRSSFNQQVNDHLTKAIDAFFAIGDGNNKANVKDGIKELIAGSLEAFIGSTSAGESEQKVYVVIPENNAFVRVDIACWKYNFEQTKLIAQSDSAVAYVLCKSVIDHTTLTIDELIYLTSDALSKGAMRKSTGPQPNPQASASAREQPADKADLTAALKAMGYESSLATSLTTDLSSDKAVKVFSAALGDVTTLRYEHIRDKALIGIMLTATTKLTAGSGVAADPPAVAGAGAVTEAADALLEVAGGGASEASKTAKNKANSASVSVLPDLRVTDTGLSTSAKYQLPLVLDELDTDGSRTPPTLASVEAYIEEMIAVWKKLKLERKEQ